MAEGRVEESEIGRRGLLCIGAPDPPAKTNEKVD